MDEDFSDSHLHSDIFSSQSETYRYNFSSLSKRNFNENDVQTR